MKQRAWIGILISLVFSGCAHGSSHVQRVNGYMDERDTEIKLSEAGRLAEPKSGEVLTMERALELALQNNASLKAVLEEIGIAGAEAAKIGLPPKPVFGGSVRYPEHEENKNVEFSVEANFMGILLTPLRSSLGGAELRKTEYHVSQKVLNFAFDVKSAYRSYQASRQDYLMRENVLKTAKAAMELSGRQKDAGNLNELDAANHRAAFAEAKISLTESEAQMNAAKEELNKLMGFGGGGIDWEVKDELPQLSASEPELRMLQALAKTKRLDLLAAQKEVEARRKDLALSRFGALEDAVIGVNTEKEPDGERLTGPTFSTSVPIFDFGQTAIQGAGARAKQSEYQLAALENEIRSQVKLAYDRVLAAKKNTESYRNELLPARTQVIDQTQKHYNFMLLGVYALLEAKHNQIVAYQEYINSLRDYWIARSDLEKAVGVKLPYEKSVPLGSVEPVKDDVEHDRGGHNHHA